MIWFLLASSSADPAQFFHCHEFPANPFLDIYNREGQVLVRKEADRCNLFQWSHLLVRSSSAVFISKGKILDDLFF